MKLLKRLLLAVVVIIVLAVAAPFIALQLLDPNDIKNEIAERISAATGRKATIEGDVKLTAYPWLGAELGTVTVGNAAGFDGTAPFFARFEQASVKVQLLPLLEREVRMDTVTISGLQLNLARASDGRTNFDDLFTPRTADNTAASEGATTEAAKPFAALALGGVHLSDATVNWRDALAKQQIRVSDMSLTTGPIDISNPQITLDIALKIVADAPQLAGAIKLKTTLSYDQAQAQIVAANMSLDLDTAGKALGGKVTTSLTGTLRFNHASGELALDGLQVASADIAFGSTQARASGAASKLRVNTQSGALDIVNLTTNFSSLKLANGMHGSVKIAGDVQADAATARITKLSTRGSLAGGPIGKGQLPFNLTGAATLDRARQLVSLPGMQLALNKFNFDQTSGSLKAVGDLAIALKTQQLSTPKIAINGNLAGRAIRGGSANIELSTVLNMNLSAGTTAFNKLALDVTNLNSMGVAGSVKLRGSGSADNAKQTFSAKDLSLTADLAGADLPNGKLSGQLTVNAVANLAEQTVKITSFNGKALGIQTNGSVTISKFSSTPSVAGALVIAPFSPRALMATFKQSMPRTADSKVLRKASIKTKFSGTLNRIKLNPFTLKLDNTTARGSASISNFANPAYVFNIKLDSVNLSRYLPPEMKNKAASPGAAVTAAATLPLETLRALRANGTLRVGKLRLAKLRVSNVLLKIAAAKGNIRLSPSSAQLYRGKYQGKITLDARGKTAKLSLNERLTGVDIGALLTDLKGQPAITGRTNVEAKLTTAGNNSDQLTRALNGTAAFRIEQGTIPQIDIVRSICNLVEGTADGETRFDVMTGSAKIVNGRIENDQIKVSSPLLRITARGVIDLPRNSLDYRGKVGLVGTCKGQGGRVRGKLNGLDIPIRITGTIANPKPRLDTSKIVESLARREIERKSERITQKIQEKIGEQAGKALGETAKKLTGSLLKGLFRN